MTEMLGPSYVDDYNNYDTLHLYGGFHVSEPFTFII